VTFTTPILLYKTPKKPGIALPILESLVLLDEISLTFFTLSIILITIQP